MEGEGMHKHASGQMRKTNAEHAQGWQMNTLTTLRCWAGRHQLTAMHQGRLSVEARTLSHSGTGGILVQTDMELGHHGHGEHRPQVILHRAQQPHQLVCSQ